MILSLLTKKNILYSTAAVIVFSASPLNNEALTTALVKGENTITSTTETTLLTPMISNIDEEGTIVTAESRTQEGLPTHSIYNLLVEEKAKREFENEQRAIAAMKRQKELEAEAARIAKEAEAKAKKERARAKAIAGSTKGSLVYKGQATYYHDSFQGKRTANGEIYDKEEYSAAIRRTALYFPYGTIVEVTNKRNNKKVRVKINDRMNDKTSAVLDLSYKAAKEIGLIRAGRANVTIKVVSKN